MKIERSPDNGGWSHPWSVSSLRAAALLIAVGAAGAPAIGAQSFGIAAGPAVERGAPTGGLVQLSCFTGTAFSHLGLRFDGLYTAQPGAIVEGTTQAGEHMSFQGPATHVSGVLGAVSYRIGRGAVQPYALFGTGFYRRDAYTAGFTLGTNAGIGADVHVRGLWFFAEGRAGDSALIEWHRAGRIDATMRLQLDGPHDGTVTRVAAPGGPVATFAVHATPSLACYPYQL